MRITKSMKFGEVINKYPETAEVFLKYGLHCVGCHVASFESIGDGARMHGLDEKKIKRLVDDLNKKVKK